MDTPALRLMVIPGCPFVQRTRMVLAAKGLEAELVEIDLAAKPEGFEALSPLGKVPVLIHEGRPLVESTVINQYLEERFPEPALTPQDPYRRAQMRFWINVDETRLVPAFYRLVMAQEPDRQRRALGQYQTELQRFETLALGGTGPFILGEALTLADVTAFTHLQRLPLLVAHRGLPVPSREGRLARWLAAVAALPAAVATAPAQAAMAEDMAPYLAGRAQGTTAVDMSPA
ncbi:MAG: glutathione S-transferase family protein [Candidatus Competibacterales bacterium]